MLASKKVIYDFGSNNGDDIPYYLCKGDFVVAVEANPRLAERITARFAAEIGQGRLTVENVVLTVEPNPAEVPFYLHKEHDFLGQFPRPKASLLHKFEEVLLPAKNVISLIETYGTPHYIKVDLEHYDQFVLRDLFAHDIRPAFISAEAQTAEVFELLAEQGGYRAFNLVEGATVPKLYEKSRIRCGKEWKTYSFPTHSAGPLGEDINGPWLSAKEFRQRLQQVGLGWRDVHATNLIRPRSKTILRRIRNLPIIAKNLVQYKILKPIRGLRGRPSFDRKFRPRTLCADPAAYGVDIRTVQFDGCKDDYQVVRAPKARLLTDRKKYIAVSVGKQLIPAASYHWRGWEAPEASPEQNPAFRPNQISAPPQVLPGSVLSLLSGWYANDNYFHWLTAVLPRMHLAQKAGWHEPDHYLLPDQAFPFQSDTLDLLGVPRDVRVASSKKASHLAADAIIATTHPRPVVQNVPAWIVDWLREAFLDKASFEHEHSLVYIGRRDATKRRLLNEEECFGGVLEPMGFKEYKLGNMSVAGQIGLFARADVIVAIHGAALTNLAFCRPGTTVLELFAEPWRLRMFENIARVRGLNYGAIVVPDESGGSSKDPDFTVSPEMLAAELQRLMDKKR